MGGTRAFAKKEQHRRNALDLQLNHGSRATSALFFAGGAPIIGSSILTDGPEARWLAWAREYADQLDSDRVASIARHAFMDGQDFDNIVGICASRRSRRY